MNINFKDALGYLTFKELEKYSFIKHAFSTRLGGVSKNEFKSLNLGFLCGDDEKCVEENYKIFCESLGFNLNLLVRTQQIHEIAIKKVSMNDITGKDFNKRVFENTDGLITNEPGIVLMTSHADCPAAFMLDPIKKIVGLAHAGWRGTVKKIASNLLEAFITNYGSSKEDVICALGPSIAKCCFEVSQSLLPEFEKLGIENSYTLKSKNDGKINIDLLEVNRKILMQAGLLSKNIFKSDVCTMCNHDLLFSHRFTNGRRGSNVAIISILE